MTSDTTYGGPFGRAAQIYRAAGWRGVLPIGRRPAQKSPPPSAFTGHGKPDPSGADIQAWLDGPEASFNIGLRLPSGVLGLDVDHYGVKTGGDTLSALIAQWGPLPPTWVTGARADGISGIRLYRVPLQLDGAQINWPGEAGKFIEIIQHGHRYANVWPSINPDAGGAMYRWWTQPSDSDEWMTADGAAPRPDALPALPDAWVRGLALAYARTEKSDIAGGQLAEWWASLRDGEPCQVVTTVLGRVRTDLQDVTGARHEAARDAAAALARLGGEGHRGARNALGVLEASFGQAVGAERVAGGEWARLLDGAVKLAATDNRTPRQSCEHDPLPTYTGPPGFDLAASIAEAQQRVESERLEQAAAAAEVYRHRADEMRSEVEKLPFEQRAEAVRRLIPEIATWLPSEQSYAKDALSSKHALSSLGVTEFGKLIRAEEKARKEAAELAVRAEQHARAAEQVERARAEGTLLPPPHAPIDVARALAGRMTVPARWWRGDFYRWSGTRYVQWRDEAVDNYLYTETADAWFEGAGEDEGTKPWRPSETKIAGVSHALSRGVLYRPSEDDPEDSPSQVACANGVYDVDTDTLLPHTPERFNLQSVPFAYDATAQASTWEWFLNDVLPSDAQRFLQQWFGYVLSGRTDLEKIANLVGRRRSGKGTIAKVLEALVGEENVASPSMPSLVGTFGEQPLIGKTLAVFSDINWSFREISEAVEIVKKISGNDSRDVQRKNREVWHGQLGVRFTIMGNDMPRFTDASGALAGRMIHVQFPGSFYGREIPGVKAQLMSELPGILNWAIAGLRDLTAAGRFSVPRTSEELAAEVRRQQSPVQAFLDDTCAQSDAAHPVPLDELYPVYKAWARDAGVEHAMNREHFSRALSSAGLQVERKMVNGVRARRVLGVVPAVADDGRSAWVALLNPLGFTPPV